VLAPLGQPSLLDVEEKLDEDQIALDNAVLDDEDGPPDLAPARTPGMMPTSIGMTFTVVGEATALRITARWRR
jgi:hypothetical protein